KISYTYKISSKYEFKRQQEFFWIFKTLVLYAGFKHCPFHKWLKLYSVTAILVISICYLIINVSVVNAAKDRAYRQKIGSQFKNWVKTLEKHALESGVSEATFYKAFQGVRLNWKLPDLQPPGFDAKTKKTKRKKKRQAEFSSPGLYFPQKRLKTLTRKGQQHYNTWGQVLADIEQAYGVDKEIILAVWGRETAYGGVKIPYYAIEALATQAFMGRRKEYFLKQLIVALQILEQGDVTPQNMKSSWAGAMGYTQFMPYDYQQFAVDYDGDGRRDIWANIPDALASTAHYLKKNGWQTGQTWGYEVRLSQGFDCRLEGFDQGRRIAEWMQLGINRAYDRTFLEKHQSQKAYLLIPGGVEGPAFLVLDNFRVIKTYNPANLYALFIGHLADRILRERDFEKRWPALKTYSRDDIRQLQTKLQYAGYPVGKIDGILGPKTRSIIGQYQLAAGLPLSCYPNRELFAHIGKISPQKQYEAQVIPSFVDKPLATKQQKDNDKYKAFYPF
ncbi:MAG: lytic murein transglycosylase, partial [Pseudomonadota bacterium]